MAYCRLAINNNDEEALKRIINYPARGIGDTTVEKIIVAANDHNISMWKVIDNINEFDIGLNAGAKTKVDEFATTIKSFSAQLKTQNAYDLGQYIAIHSGILRDLYADKSPEGVSRHENIQELLNGIKEFTESDIEIVKDETELENQLERDKQNQESSIKNQDLNNNSFFKS